MTTFAGLVALMATRVGSEIKALRSKVDVNGTNMTPWMPDVAYRQLQYVINAGTLWRLDDSDGALGAVPPGPYRPGAGGMMVAIGTTTRCGVIDADAIHGACFQISVAHTYTHMAITTNDATASLDYDSVVNVWVGLASDPPPDESTTPHGTIVVPAKTVGARVKLTTPWTPPIDTPLTVWFGPTGSPYVNLMKTSDSTTDGSIFAQECTASPVAYVTRHRGGAKVNQPNKSLYVYFSVAGTSGMRVWGEALTPPADPLAAANLNTVTLDGTAVLFDPSDYRRTDFTMGATPTTITLQNPTVPPVAGKCLPSATLLLRTPSLVTPGAITWGNLTGGSSIPLPAANQVVAASIEWVDVIVGWIVVGVRA